MTLDRIRVGVIGASPDGGWAPMSHIPALRALPQYELTAVCTSREDSARRAAERFGAAHAFTDTTELATHPEVDLVVVAIKTPAHADPVQAALAAGKHVHCEWPLARTSKEAETLAAAADEAGVHHSVGLQARYAPAVGHARELIDDGYLGRITSVTVHATRGKSIGGQIGASGVYTLDRTSGAGTTEVAGGHTLDLLEHLVGPIEHLSAALAVQRRHFTVVETGAAVESDTPDHVLLNAGLAGGAVAAVHIHDAKLAEAGTRVEICGTEGELAVCTTGPGAAHGVQVSELRLLGARRGEQSAWQELSVPEQHRTVPDGIPGTAVLNVAQLYAQLARDIRDGGRHVPDFEAGLRLHRLLDAVRLSDETGTRQSLAAQV